MNKLTRTFPSQGPELNGAYWGRARSRVRGLGGRWLVGGLGGLALLLGACSGDDMSGLDGGATDVTAGTANGEDGSTSAMSTTMGTDSGSDSMSTGVGTETGAMDATNDADSTITGVGTETGAEGCFDSPDGPCCGVSAQWPDELISYKVMLDVKVNGAPYKGSVYDDADIYLVNVETGDRAHLGRVSGGLLSGYVLAGKYRVSYEARDGAFLVPVNSRALIGDELDVTADSNTPTPVDIVSLDVELDLKFNGEAPSLSPYDDALISVSRNGGTERTTFGKTSQAANGAIRAKLVEGSYEFFYESEDRGVKMPYNALALLDETSFLRGDDGADDEFSAKLAIDVPVVTMTGTIDFDGDAPPKSPFDHGHIYLRDRATESVTQIADTMDGVIQSVPVLAEGEYDLFYGAEMVGVAAPANRWGRLNTELILGSEEALSGAQLMALAELSLPIMTVEGVITVDGESKPVDPENRGELLAGDGAGDRGELGDVSLGIKSNLLMGDYDVFFRHDVSDGGLPANTFGRVSGEAVKSESMLPLAVNVESTSLQGTIKVGGKTPPLSAYDSGEIYLRNAAGDRVFLGQTRAGSYSRRVVEGTYDVYYAVVNTQGGVPANGETLVTEGLVIGGEEQTFDIDIGVVTVGSMSLPTLPMGSGKARFFLRNVETKDEVFVGKAGEVAQIMMLEGEYELVYRMETLGLGTPRNDGAVLACYSSEE